ncbi:MAG: ABC transporter permease [Chitinophagaceae bacterium]|nr:ABC transporter permease [Chitinophagaceae bacterium]
MEKMQSIIKPPAGFSFGLKEVWQYRELFYFFTWRDIKVKYKQAYLGVFWALLQPLGMMVIFTFLFSKTWKIDTGIIQYPIFVLAGLICWNLFSSSVSHAAESMIQHAGIINKIYFPRIIIPGSSVLVALFDFMMGFIVFIIFCLIYKQPVHWPSVWCFPAGIIIVLIAAFGAGTFLSALNVKYRDFRYTIGFFLQVMFFASQVIYPLQSIQQSWLKYILAINPVNAAIELFRSAFAGGYADTTTVYIGIASAFLLLLIGIYYFRKTEAYFADIV